MGTETKRPGPESTLDEVRAQLVAEATRALLDEGIEIGLQHIRLSDAIEAAGVTRATAYRSLAHDTMSPQDRLRFEVLSQVLLRDSRSANHESVTNAVNEVLAERGNQLASSDIAERTLVLRELIRAGSEVSHQLIVRSRERSILVAAYGAITSRSERSTLWVDELRGGEAILLRTFTALYTAMADLFRLRLRDGHTMEHLTTAIASISEGLAMRHLVNDHLVEIPLLGRDGATDELWTLQGMTVWAIVRQFMEPIDPNDPFVDLGLP